MIIILNWVFMLVLYPGAIGIRDVGQTQSTWHRAGIELGPHC